jgi:hypothetical protein
MWTGIKRGGYGIHPTPINGDERAHRFSFHIFKGNIPFNHDVHHTCGHKLCVNPQHLKAVIRSKHMAKHGRGKSLPDVMELTTTVRLAAKTHEDIGTCARKEQRTWANMLRLLVQEALEARQNGRKP